MNRNRNNGLTFREAIAAAGKDRIAQAAAAGKDRQKSAVLYVGRLGHRIAFGPDGIVLRKQAYPVAGARAEVNDFRSGLVGRKHTTELTITLASGEVLAWHETDTGATARMTHNAAVKFAAAVNSAAAR